MTLLRRGATRWGQNVLLWTITATGIGTRRTYSTSSGFFTDTIFALSSAPGRAAVAVLRLSGPHADSTLSLLLPPERSLPPPRAAQLNVLRHPVTGAALDNALCLRFPGPRSATGEDVVELQVHGGPAVVHAVADALSLVPGVRPAEPGEFTRRAFQLGRLDLTEVEGLADLLAAETETQRVQALALAGGAARRQSEAWRGLVKRCLSRIEAIIDFGEDEGIADTVADGVTDEVKSLRQELETHMAAGAGGELVRQGVRVALVGPPNAGKSSLLNALAGREVAIVSSIPGTTRDVLEVSLDLGGIKVVVNDSAGLRPAADPIEEEGIKRSRAVAAAAHVVVELCEPGGQWSDELEARGAATLRVLNKVDLLPQKVGGYRSARQSLMTRENTNVVHDVEVSCLTGEGLSALTRRLGAIVRDIVNESKAGGGKGGAQPSLLNRARHRYHINRCIEALKRYELAPSALELAAEELRMAAVELGKVTGAIDTEEVLESIFSEFCIGK